MQSTAIERTLEPDRERAFCRSLIAARAACGPVDVDTFSIPIPALDLARLRTSTTVLPPARQAPVAVALYADLEDFIAWLPQGQGRFGQEQ